MWSWDYEEGTNIRDGVRGTVTGGCSKGIFLALEDGQEAFAHFGGLNPGTTVLCTVLKKAIGGNIQGRGLIKLCSEFWRPFIGNIRRIITRR